MPWDSLCHSATAEETSFLFLQPQWFLACTPRSALLPFTQQLLESGELCTFSTTVAALPDLRPVAEGLWSLCQTREECYLENLWWE